MGKGECKFGKPKGIFFYFITLPGIYLDVGRGNYIICDSIYLDFTFQIELVLFNFSWLSAPQETTGERGSPSDPQVSLICQEKGPRLPLTKLTKKGIYWQITVFSSLMTIMKHFGYLVRLCLTQEVH